MKFGYILDLLKQYIIFAFVFCAIFMCVVAFSYFVVYKKIMHGEKKLSKKNIIILIVSCIYLCIVFCAVFLNRTNYTGDVQSFFSSYRLAWYSCSVQGWRNITLNILLFIPLGFLFPFWSEKLNKFLIALSMGLLFSVSVETLQYVMKIGVFECDDILNNTLGVVLGYCLLQILRQLHRKKYSKAVAYFLPFLIPILIFAGLGIYYCAKPYGNLFVSYYNSKDMDEINVSVNYTPLDNTSAFIYQSKSETKEKAFEKAERLFDTVNVKIDTNTEFTDENNMYMVNSKNAKFHFVMNLDNGSYNFQNEDYFQIDSVKPDTSYSEKQVREALKKFSVVLPENSVFKVNENSNYEFYVNTVSDGILYNGTLYCTMFPNEELGEIDSHILSLQCCSKEFGKSEVEALQQIKNGKFNIDAELPKDCDIEIKNCSIIYLADSKSYYQPVYQFNAVISSNGNEKKTEILIPVLS